MLTPKAGFQRSSREDSQSHSTAPGQTPSLAVASALRGQDLRPHSVMMTVNVQAPCAHSNSVLILGPDIKAGQLCFDAQAIASVDLDQDRAAVDFDPAVRLLMHTL